MNPKLREKTLESLSAVLPITGIVLLISIFLIPMELGRMVMFRKEHLPLQYRFNAEGTAPSEIMDMLGLGSIDKCGMHSEAKGLVMSMPIDSVTGI